MDAQTAFVHGDARPDPFEEVIFADYDTGIF
jgi:hypothetical protein